jgi:hypothetical protein
MTSIPLADIEQSACNSEYETLPPERYPDPANLLPISVGGWIFVHRAMNFGLTLGRSSEQVRE